MITRSSIAWGEGVDRIGGEPISARMKRKAPIRHLDPMLLFVSIALSIYGAVVVYSATLQQQLEAGLDGSTYLKRQIAFVVAGVVSLLVVAAFDYRWVRGFAPFVYGGTILLLIVVLTPIGEVQKGASRWINFGAFQMQPSELGKVALVIALAAYLGERKGEVRARDTAIVCGLALIPCALIYLEPDLGSTLVYVAITAALLLVGGAKIRHFLFLGALAALTIAVVLQAGLLKDYQLQRLTAFTEPNCDVQGPCYNLTQSKIAIGSGGIRGKGLQIQGCEPRTSLVRRGQESDLSCANTQTSLDFVPEQHTDFIFTAVGEQLGFMGSAALLSLFGILIWRALRIATMSRDLFGTLIAAGIAGFWIFQLFVNVGMTMGIMPITGIPLPFLSYGGSSLITNFIAVGLLLNVHMRRFI
jgi:rod shape determining protein RodA